MEAIKFLRQHLLDAVEFTEVPDQHNRLIEFLAAEGVLTSVGHFVQLNIKE